MRSRASTLQDAYLIEDPERVKQATKRISEILDAKYEKADLEKIVSNCPHLSHPQREQLLNLLKTYESMFDGTLGVWQGDPYNIHLKDQVVPYHGKAFKVPKYYENQVKMEVKRLEQIGVLKKVNHSQWAAPCFIIPKKDQTIRFHI